LRLAIEERAPVEVRDAELERDGPVRRQGRDQVVLGADPAVAARGLRREAEHLAVEGARPRVAGVVVRGQLEPVHEGVQREHRMRGQAQQHEGVEQVLEGERVGEAVVEVVGRQQVEERAVVAVAGIAVARRPVDSHAQPGLPRELRKLVAELGQHGGGALVEAVVVAELEGAPEQEVELSRADGIHAHGVGADRVHVEALGEPALVPVALVLVGDREEAELRALEPGAPLHGPGAARVAHVAERAVGALDREDARRRPRGEGEELVAAEVPARRDAVARARLVAPAHRADQALADARGLQVAPVGLRVLDLAAEVHLLAPDPQVRALGGTRLDVELAQVRARRRAPPAVRVPVEGERARPVGVHAVEAHVLELGRDQDARLPAVLDPHARTTPTEASQCRSS
jgi:hypothetical protein